MSTIGERPRISMCARPSKCSYLRTLRHPAAFSLSLSLSSPPFRPPSLSLFLCLTSSFSFSLTFQRGVKTQPDCAISKGEGGGRGRPLVFISLLVRNRETNVLRVVVKRLCSRSRERPGASRGYCASQVSRKISASRYRSLRPIT